MPHLLKVLIAFSFTYSTIDVALASQTPTSTTKDIVISSMSSAQSESQAAIISQKESLVVSVLTEGPYNTWIPNPTEIRYSSGQRFRVKVSSSRNGQLAFFNTNPAGITASEPLLIMELSAGVEIVSDALEIAGDSGVDLLHLVLLPEGNRASPFEVFTRMQDGKGREKDIRLVTEESETASYFLNPQDQGAFVTLRIDHSKTSSKQFEKSEDLAAREKFLAPALVNYAGMAVFQALNTWVGARIAPNSAEEIKPTFAELLWPIGIELLQNTYNNWVTTLNSGSAQWATLESNPRLSSIVILGQPDQPLNALSKGFSATASWPKTSNYQGVGVMLLTPAGKDLAPQARPLSAKLGEDQPFKLQITSTVDALVYLDHLGKGKQTRLYPTQSGKAVRIKSGEKVILPLGANEYFSTKGMGANDLFDLHVIESGKPIKTMIVNHPVYRVSTDNETLFTQRQFPNSAFSLSQRFAPHH